MPFSVPFAMPKNRVEHHLNMLGFNGPGNVSHTGQPPVPPNAPQQPPFPPGIESGGDDGGEWSLPKYPPLPPQPYKPHQVLNTIISPCHRGAMVCVMPYYNNGAVAQPKTVGVHPPHVLAYYAYPLVHIETQVIQYMVPGPNSATLANFDVNALNGQGWMLGPVVTLRHYVFSGPQGELLPCGPYLNTNYSDWSLALAVSNLNLLSSIRDVVDTSRLMWTTPPWLSGFPEMRKLYDEARDNIPVVCVTPGYMARCEQDFEDDDDDDEDGF